VSILGRSKIGFLSNEPVKKVTLSVPSFRGGTRKTTSRSTCKCPTDIPIYLADGKSSNSIMVITPDRETSNKKESSPKTQSDRTSIFQYIRLLNRKKKRYTFKFEPIDQKEDIFDLTFNNAEIKGSDVGHSDTITSVSEK